MATDTDHSFNAQYTFSALIELFIVEVPGVSLDRDELEHEARMHLKGKDCRESSKRSRALAQAILIIIEYVKRIALRNDIVKWKRLIKDTNQLLNKLINCDSDLLSKFWRMMDFPDWVPDGAGSERSALEMEFGPHSATLEGALSANRSGYMVGAELTKKWRIDDAERTKRYREMLAKVLSTGGLRRNEIVRILCCDDFALAITSPSGDGSSSSG